MLGLRASDRFSPSQALIALPVFHSELSLVTCVLNLISDLQAIGTVPAIDINSYLKNLSSPRKRTRRRKM
jgi:hypothetical protein